MCVKKFGKYQKSDLGYFIEREGNLIHKGGCLGECVHLINASIRMNVFFMTAVYNEVCIYNDSVIYSNALVDGRVEFCKNLHIYERENFIVIRI